MVKQLIMIKTRTDRNRLEPAYAEGEELMNSLKPGMYKVTIKQSRNPDFHRLAFAFVGKVFKYQNFYTDIQILRDALSIEAGHVDHIVLTDKLSYVRPKSWSFDDMDNLEFYALIAKIVDIAVKMALENIESQRYQTNINEISGSE